MCIECQSMLAYTCSFHSNEFSLQTKVLLSTLQAPLIETSVNKENLPIASKPNLIRPESILSFQSNAHVRKNLICIYFDVFDINDRINKQVTRSFDKKNS
jgi:hypothetical protein